LSQSPSAIGITTKAIAFFFLAGLASPSLLVPKPSHQAQPGLSVQLGTMSRMTANLAKHTVVKDMSRGVGKSGK